MVTKLNDADKNIITIANIKTYCVDGGELYGDDLIYENIKFDAYIKGKFYKTFDVSKSKVDERVIVKRDIVKKLISRELLPECFEILEDTVSDDDFLDYACEDDFMEDIKTDVRDLVGRVDTYQDGMDYFFVVKDFLDKHFTVEFYDLVMR